MRSSLSEIEKCNPRLQYVQIALGGSWETAVRIDLDGARTVPKFIADKLDKSIAFEIFYKLEDDKMTFVGLRYSPSFKLAKTPEQFLRLLTRSIDTIASMTLRETLVYLGQVFNDDLNTYIKQEVEYAEAGVVDHWMSLGSVILRRRGESLLSIAELREKLGQNEVLSVNDKNYVAVELSFRRPEWWLGVQVSRLKKHRHVIDVGLLAKTANVF
jgi:hypothetical protein